MYKDLSSTLKTHIKKPTELTLACKPVLEDEEMIRSLGLTDHTVYLML